MTSSKSELPEIDNLQSGLNSALKDEGLLKGKLTIVARQPNVYASTYPSEIVTCRIGDGPKVQLFCKYSTGWINEAHGHRGGVEYEAKVYQRLLKYSDLSLARFVGIYQQPHDNCTWLVLEYLTDSMKITASPELTAPLRAARWLGVFHSFCSTKMTNPSLTFIRRYDAEYYKGWAMRALSIAKLSEHDYQWVVSICDHFDDVISELTTFPATIIHGEYYPKNVLFHDGSVYPVDWESTAIGPGEIDILTLTDGWNPDARRQLVHEYQQARWPEETPHDFNRRMCTASIYVQFRWLSDHDEWFPAYKWRLDTLRRSAEDIGLL